MHKSKTLNSESLSEICLKCDLLKNISANFIKTTSKKKKVEFYKKLSPNLLQKTDF